MKGGQVRTTSVGNEGPIRLIKVGTAGLASVVLFVDGSLFIWVSVC